MNAPPLAPPKPIPPDVLAAVPPDLIIVIGEFILARRTGKVIAHIKDGCVMHATREDSVDMRGRDVIQLRETG